MVSLMIALLFQEEGNEAGIQNAFSLPRSFSTWVIITGKIEIQKINKLTHHLCNKGPVLSLFSRVVKRSFVHKSQIDECDNGLCEFYFSLSPLGWKEGWETTSWVRKSEMHFVFNKLSFLPPVLVGAGWPWTDKISTDSVASDSHSVENKTPRQWEDGFRKGF